MIEARKLIQEMKAYSPPLEGRRGFVRLDFNENTSGAAVLPAGFPADMVSAYPEYGSFRRDLAAACGMPEDGLLLTNGSGEALFTAAFTFIEPGEDAAITSAPTFQLIPHNLKLAGARLVEVPVTSDLEFDAAAIEAELRRGARFAAFASPDNPTGAALNPDLLEEWCGRFRDTLFLIDEAYAEYCRATVLGLAGKLGNLLVSRTFSKAWGLAGLRLGMLAGPPRLIAEMAKVRSPYSVNAAAVHAAGLLLPRRNEVLAGAAELMRRKEGFVSEARTRGYRVTPGRANFFLLHAGLDSAALVEHARAGGVLVRDRSFMHGCRGAVRVTVGTAEENRKFLGCLDGFAACRALIFDLDDTIVDTRDTYDTAVDQLMRKFSGKPVDAAELKDLRSAGGFNDDWDSTVEMLRRRGVRVTREQVDAAGKVIYLKLASKGEKPLISFDLLRSFRRRYRLFLHTGRTRDEYAPVWGRTMDSIFESVMCRDDAPMLRPKPAPDQLLNLLGRHGCEGGIYVGNSVDDMRAAAGAGLARIGVTTTMEREVLLSAGAEHVVDSTGEVAELLGM